MRNWKTIKEYKEILFDEFNGIARITINRPRYRNAFTPLTVWEARAAPHVRPHHRFRECHFRTDGA